MPVLLLFALAACSTSDAPESDTTDVTDAPTASTDSLTSAQRSRLGPTLRRIIEEGEQEAEASGKRDGASVYSVIIVGSDSDELRTAGIPLSSVQDSIMTARLTVEEIRTASALETVREIQAASEVQTYDSRN